MDLCLEGEDLSQLLTDEGRIRRVNTYHRAYRQEGDHCYDAIIILTVFESVANMDGGGGGGG